MRVQRAAGRQGWAPAPHQGRAPLLSPLPQVPGPPAYERKLPFGPQEPGRASSPVGLQGPPPWPALTRVLHHRSQAAQNGADLGQVHVGEVWQRQGRRRRKGGWRGRLRRGRGDGGRSQRRGHAGCGCCCCCGADRGRGLGGAFRHLCRARGGGRRFLLPLLHWCKDGQERSQAQNPACSRELRACTASGGTPRAAPPPRARFRAQSAPP